MKILVCTLAINEWYFNIVKYAIKSFYEYSLLNNYTFILDKGDVDTVYDGSRQEPWFKIKLIHKILKENPECDYVVWIDADCQLLLPEIKLEYFIKKFSKPETEIIVTMDNNILNTGVMFVKNTPFTIDLMDRVWNHHAGSIDYFKDFHEQTALADIYTGSEEVKNKVFVIPYGLKDELVVYWGNYYPGHCFLIHCARCSFNKIDLLYMMDMFYPGRLEEETDDEYKSRVLWLNNPEYCERDIHGWLRGEHVERRYSARAQKFLTGELEI